MKTRDPRPLIAHVIHRLAVGGLENGLVNLVNHSPYDRYSHVIICMTDYTDFRARITRDDVNVVALRKHRGQDFAVYTRAWKLLRRLRPAIVHTRTWATLELQLWAAMAGVPARIHSEHGQTIHGPDGSRLRHRIFRRMIDPGIQHYVAVSHDLAKWLQGQVSSPASRVTQIYNGVDTSRFYPGARRAAIGAPGFAPEDAFVIGTVGRLQPVKDQITLVRAFLKLRSQTSQGQRLRLVIAGDGPMMHPIAELVAAHGAGDAVWLAGERSDIPDILRGIDVFVLPSQAEGTCNTILEAMATSIPVIATRVGGNPELVDDGRTGLLVRPADPDDMSAAMSKYLASPKMKVTHGEAGRAMVRQRFSVSAMVHGYMGVYDRVLEQRRVLTLARIPE
jgi:sugar transferase (PEP-CTERM/EpsH1 system associated)